ncbi:MAG: outer membrane beta-barrel protein [Terracidiphilus sp.]|nr:outer membrane beta-barrel protein [Terracidiphilus sp.]
MRLKPILRIILATLFTTAAFPVFSQTVPAARQGVLPITVGGGVSIFDPDYPDYGQGRMLGGTVWIDYVPHWVPKRLYGLGLEVEGRDINYHRSSSQPANLREDTLMGGAIYSWRHYEKFRPYGKFLAGLGNTDYGTQTTPEYRFNQSRTIIGVGGGLEYRVIRSFWVRGDYEYQRWPDFYNTGTKFARPLKPQGITVGVSYDLSRPRFFSK